MDGREGMTVQGSASYYLLNRSGVGPSNIHGSGGGGGSATAQGGGALHQPPVFKPNISGHPNVGGGSVGGSLNFSQGMRITGGSEMVKKKRGRPRKYAPTTDGSSNMSLGLSSPASASKRSSSDPGEKTRRGRPPGTGWKQQLAPLGEWMNSSAGLAFTPHVLHIGIGEDIAAKILAFAQQRPRALCILSGSGSVSAVTLHQPGTSAGSVTYEGRFEILCLSGSYLLAESGGPHNRTGGISISVCSPDGHMIGGAIGGRLIAANPIQVVACSFVYGGSTKAKTKAESGTSEENKYVLEQSAEKSSTPISQSLTPNSGASVWALGSRTDVKNSQSDIDLTRG